MEWQNCNEFSSIFCSVVQSCQQLDAEGEAKQKALWHNQNSTLELCQTSGSGEASPGKHGFENSQLELEKTWKKRR